MSKYVDGFAFPIPNEKISEYRVLAESVAEIWKEHGAVEYCEFSGDDMRLEGTCSFVDALVAREGETVIFGWVAFDSRESRDNANRKVAEDPRVAKLMSESNCGFDASRMMYGGFRSFLHQ